MYYFEHYIRKNIEIHFNNFLLVYANGNNIMLVKQINIIIPEILYCIAKIVLYVSKFVFINLKTEIKFP